MQIFPLNDEQLDSLSQTTDRHNPPVRFLADGCNVNICTGVCMTKGTNVIYQLVYWDRPKEFVNKVLKFLRENNPGVTFKVVTG